MSTAQKFPSKVEGWHGVPGCLNKTGDIVTREERVGDGSLSKKLYLPSKQITSHRSGFRLEGEQGGVSRPSIGGTKAERAWCPLEKTNAVFTR